MTSISLHKFSGTGFRLAAVAALAAAIAMGVDATPASASRLESEESATVQLNGERRIYVKNARGKTIVVGRRGLGVVEVHALKVVRANRRSEAEQLLAALDFEVTTEGDQVSVVTDHPDRSSQDNFWKSLFTTGDRAYIDYTIEVPAGFHAKVSSASGDVQITSLDGDVKVFGSSGDVFLKDLGGEVLVEISSGDVEVRDVAGDVRVRLSSGDAEIRTVGAFLSVHATSGNIYAYGVGGDARIELSSGDFVVDGCSGSLQAKTTSGDGEISNVGGDIKAVAGSGDLRLAVVPRDRREFTALTTSGDIEIRFEKADPHGFYLEVHTSSGTIEGDLDIRLDKYSRRMLTGVVGDGMGRLYVETASGNVRIEQASR